jgi:hypothetical protein
MKFRSFFWSIIDCGLFFTFATSTSPEENFGPVREIILNAEAILADSNLILTNNDTLDIFAANLFLSYAPDMDVGGAITASNQFLKVNYSLEKDGVDTISFSAFMQNELPFPSDTMPIRFELFFNQSDSISVFFVKDF